MKIFLIIPSLGPGGAERVISTLANKWATINNCSIHLVLLSSAPDFYNIDPRITTHRIGYHGGQRMFGKVVSVLRGMLSLRRLLKQHRPDVVLSFIREANIFSLLAATGLDLKIIISERDSPNSSVSPLYSKLRKITYKKSAGIIVQTEQYKNFITTETGNERIKIIPNPVRQITPGNASKERIIINVGRLINEKGHSYLLRSFAKTRNTMEWKLTILGDGPLKERLEDEARALGISERVNFVGATKDVDSWLSRSSIFAFSSVSEGFPNALAEAMSAGLPCVSFNCVAGPQDLITDEVSGFLVNVGDIDAMAAKLDELISSGDLRERLSLEARAVAANLNIDKISNDYYTFLSEA